MSLHPLLCTNGQVTRYAMDLLALFDIRPKGNGIEEVATAIRASTQSGGPPCRHEAFCEALMKELGLTDKTQSFGTRFSQFKNMLLECAQPATGT
jgi:hypothetical protein